MTRGRPAVMGILNVTPDSFSDGGENPDPATALARAEAMVAAGAGFVDVGGESTRPGAEPVDPAEEQRRVLPVIEALGSSREMAEARISIDTRNASTARAAVALGATVINDVSASLWPVAAETGAGWVAMHMTGDPRTMQLRPTYTDVLEEVRRFLDERAALAEAAGVTELWVDPGIGFAKTTEHNLRLLAGVPRLVEDGRPVLIGTSRKRSLGELLARSDASAAHRRGTGPQPDTPPVEVPDRLEGSLVTAVWAMIGGVDIVRAHDISATVGAAETFRRTVAGR
ncbi:MAG: dihydropteroate synthase [Microthrixaceae bacterium]